MKKIYDSCRKHSTCCTMGFWGIDKNNKISFINEKGCDILKVKNSDVIVGQDLNDLAHNSFHLRPGVFHDLTFQVDNGRTRCVAQISPPAYVYDDLNYVSDIPRGAKLYKYRKQAVWKPGVLLL